MYNRLMKLYFARHGETDVNSGPYRTGVAQFDELLNSTGLAQAEQLAAQLKDVEFKTILSSPLQRTMQTADIVNQFHNLPIQTDDAWKELFSRYYLDAESWHNAFDFDSNKVIKYIEPVADFFKRVHLALDKLKKTYETNDSILLISHGGVHQAVYAYANKLNLTGNMRLSPTKNCEVRIYEL